MPQSPTLAAPEVPKYRVLLRSFFAPHTVEPGTEILYEGVPGNHLEPLNDAARAKMEEFYTTEFPEKDPRTQTPTGKFITPRESLRTKTYEAASEHPITITAEPSTDPKALEVQSLGEIMAARKNTNQRPPPAPMPMAIPVAPTPVEGKTDG